MIISSSLSDTLSIAWSGMYSLTFSFTSSLAFTRSPPLCSQMLCHDTVFVLVKSPASCIALRTIFSLSVSGRTVSYMLLRKESSIAKATCLSAIDMFLSLSILSMVACFASSHSAKPFASFRARTANNNESIGVFCCACVLFLASSLNCFL